MSGHFKTQAIEAMKDAPPEIRSQNLQNFAQALRQFGATSQAEEIQRAANGQNKNTK